MQERSHTSLEQNICCMNSPKICSVDTILIQLDKNTARNAGRQIIPDPVHMNNKGPAPLPRHNWLHNEGTIQERKVSRVISEVS